MVKRKEKIILTVGKRRLAKARAKIEPGEGKIYINSKPLDLWGTQYLRLWIREPLVIAGDEAKKINAFVNVRGGGIVGQAEAIRQALARGLVEFFKDKKLKRKLEDFDRHLLVYDHRRNEPHKPSRSKKGPRRHKQRSKR